MAVVCERALAYLRASLSSFTGSAGLWIGLTFWHWRGNLDFGQNGKDAAVNRVVAIFCRSPLECRSGIWCLGSVGRRQYRTGVVGVPSVYRICDLRGPDYHRCLGRRSLSLPPPAPALRLSVLPFGRLSLVLCDCQWLLNVVGASGVAQSAIHWWYFGCLFGLWLTPLGLAAAFYFIPIILDRPLYSEGLALLGFWVLAGLAGWTGLTQIIGGPLPAWMVTTSIVAKVLLIIPIIAVAANLHLTMKGRFELIKSNLALRFLMIGAMLYGLSGIWDAINAFRTIDRITQFTLAVSARNYLALFGFVLFISFGAIYFIVPRILGRFWRYALLVRWHFWLSIAGLGFLVFDLTIAGVLQGFGLMDPKVPIPAILDMIAPFVSAQILAAVVIVVANIVSLFSMLTVLVNPVWHAATEKAPEPILDLGEEMPVA